MRPAECHPERKYKAKGLCASCYSMLMHKENKQRATCHPDRPHWGKGMCYSCWRKDYRINQNPLENSEVARLIGFTIEDYNRVFKEQNGLCALCRKPPKEGKRFDIDHDHKTMQFRGLLCNNCNRGIGHLKHDSEVLRRAATYLEYARFLHGMKN